MNIKKFLMSLGVATAVLSQFAAAAPPEKRIPTLDDEFNMVAEQNPAFGGMFFDENGDLNVYLTDAKQKAAVHAVLRSVFGVERLQGAPSEGRSPGKRALPAGEFHVQKGKFGIKELEKVRKNAHAVFAIKGTVFTDLDEARNRITIGIEDESQRKSVEDVLISNNVPLDAVIIEVTHPISAQATVQDYFRPTKGGTQISMTSGGTCTLGFNAYLGGTRGFVTNSHCTAVQGGTEGTGYFQANFPSWAGYEFSDPGYFTSIWPWECPWFRRCRYSDSAFVAYYSAVSSNFARIAQPTSWTGSLTINSTAPEFRIVSERPSVVTGDILDKVGRTTGWTYGRVIGTCQDVNVSDTDITMKCQDRVQSYNSAKIVLPGDSGSPVFRWRGIDVDLAGILWGADSDNTEFMFSRIGFVRSELGSLSTF